MTATLRVALADDDQSALSALKEMLSELGHEVVLAAQTGRELVEGATSGDPELILADIKMPDLDGLDAVAAIYEQSPKPIILISGYHDREYIERAQETHVLAYLVKPVKQGDLEAAIALAMRRFHEFQALQNEAADLRKALSDRKIIERAKGLLMKHLGIDEQDAFRRLQKLASSKNKKLVEIAHMVLTAAEALSN